MDRNLYEELIEQDNVMDQETLEGIRSVLIEDRRPEFRIIEDILKRAAIDKPPPEIGLSTLTYYQLAVKLAKARKILAVLRQAETMYGRAASFGFRQISALRDEWSRFCRSLADEAPVRRVREAASVTVHG